MKVLYSQISASDRVCYDGLVKTELAPTTETRQVKNNIFPMRRASDYAAQAVELAYSFQLPWSLTNKLANSISDFLESDYPRDVYDAFSSGFDRYNDTHQRT